MAANFGNVYLLSTLPLNGNFTPFETRWNVYTAVVVLGIKKVSLNSFRTLLMSQQRLLVFFA